MAVTDSHFADVPDSPADRLLAGAQRAARGAGERLANIVTDLFLPDAQRLSDQQRATMTQLLAKLVAAVEDDLRHRLVDALDGRAPPELLASLAAGRLAVAAPILDRSGLLRDPELVGVLLRRSEEHRLVTALHLATMVEPVPEHVGGQSLFDRLLARGDAELGRAVMTLLIAESRRFDRFQDPLLARTDLPAELQHALVWRVAAALRDYMVSQQQMSPAQADRALSAAATAALAAYDEGDTLEGRAVAMARRLHSLNLLDDQLILDAVREGKVALAVAGLAVRAGIDAVAIWEMLLDPDGSRVAVLLRAIRMGRHEAAELMLRLAVAAARPDAEEMVAAQLDGFDALDPARADEAISPWRMDEAYRKAVAELSAGLAGRP